MPRLSFLGMFLMLSACQPAEFDFKKHQKEVSEPLSKLAADNPHLGYHRLVRLEGQERSLLQALGYLPHNLQLFEYFEGGESPTVEVQVSLITLFGPNLNNNWELTFEDKVFSATKVNNKSTDAQKKATKKNFHFAEAIFELPAKEFENMKGGGELLISARKARCSVAAAKLADFHKLRSLALDSGERAVEMHLPLGAEHIEEK